MASSAGVQAVGAIFDDELRVRAVQATGPVTVVTGTEGDDLLLARRGGTRAGGRPTKGADRIEGRGGDDQVDASGGDDEVFGDFASASGTDPTADYRGGNDRLKGGAGNDAIWGEGPGLAMSNASFGDDWIDGGPGDDTLVGDTEGLVYGLSGGNDRIFGGAGNDVVYGDCSDAIGRVGRGGDDSLYGGFGNDLLIGDAPFVDFQGFAGNDLLDGGAGDDVLIGDGALETAGSGGDRLIGGAGNDRLYGDTPLGVDFDRIAGSRSDFPNDLYYAQWGSDDFLDGGTGDDLLVGGAGSDELTGGSGDDVFLFFPTRRYESEVEIDRILDFQQGLDKLDLTLWGLDGTVLDTDEDGRLGDGDDAVFGDGAGNLVIDLGSATGLADPDRAVVILEGVSNLRLDDLVPLSAAA
jgi:Ca2+-binding RTX toxin-like protein